LGDDICKNGAPPELKGKQQYLSTRMPLLRSSNDLIQSAIIEFGLYLAVKPQRGDILVAPAGRNSCSSGGAAFFLGNRNKVKYEAKKNRRTFGTTAI
jgi:hypothetical protein